MTELIWKEFNVQLLGFIKSRINNEELAKDLLQEIFIKIHQKIDTIQNKQKITSWIYQITRNSIIDYYRKKKEDTTQLSLNINLPEEIEPVNSDFTKCLEPFIKQLSGKDQHILNNIYFGNVSQKEYAETYNLSYSAAKSRVQRAKEKLKSSFITCCKVNSDKYGNIISHDKDHCSC